MSGHTLIAGGTVVTAAGSQTADILVENGRIAAVGPALPAPAGAERIDAGGLMVFPGGIDVHTHLDYETGTAHTADDFDSGTRAAAFGGTTTVVDFAFQHKNESPTAALDDWKARAAKSCIDVGAHMMMTDLAPAHLADMRRLMREEGVTSVKLFMAYPGFLMVEDEDIQRAMRLAAEENGLVSLHAEAGHPIKAAVAAALARGDTAARFHALTRPPETETMAVRRAMELAEATDARVYIVHLSVAAALAEADKAKARGVKAHVETCPHYLFLDDSAYETDDLIAAAGYIMSPPLRPRENVEPLWRGLADGRIEVVGSDYCGFCLSEKTLGAHYAKRGDARTFAEVPNGAPGIEERWLALLDAALTGRIGLDRFVDATSTAPARLFGMAPRKGTIAAGADADLVLVDPNATTTLTRTNLHGRVDYTLFEGKVVQGAIRRVLLRGQTIVDGDRWLGRPGGGEYLRRGATVG
jgi:dihydropyrimidinase